MLRDELFNYVQMKSSRVPFIYLCQPVVLLSRKPATSQNYLFGNNPGFSLKKKWGSFRFYYRRDLGRETIFIKNTEETELVSHITRVNALTSPMNQ